MAHAYYQILTGTDNHIAGLGSLVEWLCIPPCAHPKAIKESPAPARGKPGYEGYLNERVVTVSELLQDAGYHTLLSGKWHLGLTKERSPWSRGFDRSFTHLPGASNHFGWEPQLEEVEAPRPFQTTLPLHMEDDQYVNELPQGWYSSDSYGDILKRYLRDWKAGRDADKPFFAYLPFTAPHWPLQAPQEYIQHYRGIYDDGPDGLRLRRLERLKELGLVEKDVEPHLVVASEVPEWSELTAEQKVKSCRAMEVYAGMGECIDHNVGKIVQHLKDIGEYDNTFIMFLSDNGAEGGAHEASPVFHGGPMAHLQKYYDNSLDNLGNFDSFIWYGPRWAQAATAPCRLYKSYTTEGGIRVPFVGKFPVGHLNLPISPGGISDNFATVMDIAPTCLEMAGVTHPAPNYRGREVVGMRGKSMVSWLDKKSDRIHDEDFVNGWETSGRAAIGKGVWKAVYLPSPRGTDQWQLYNLEKDLGEVHDLAAERPDILKDLLKLWDQYVVETGVVPLDPALGEYIAATEEQLPDNGWMEYEF